MAHYPRPFFRAPRNRWYVQLDGKQINLGPDKDQAFREYHRLMAERGDEKPAPPQCLTVAEIYDKFLTWCRDNREALTYQGYHNFIQKFLTGLKDTAYIPATELRPFHISEWVQKHPRWGPTRRRNAIIHLQRPFNWAYKLRYISDNPIRYIEKPQAKRRENPVAPQDFEKILANVSDQPFRDLILFAWESGCRPQEARHIEPHHVNLKAARIEIPPAEAKGRKRWRIIRLTDKALEIVNRLLNNPGKLFLNSRGKPWKSQTIVSRFRRLRTKLGKAWSAYDLRHGFAGKLLEKGIDHLTVAELMGHKDGVMVARVYQHLGSNNDYLDEALRKASS